MPALQIIIALSGGQVQDVFCTIPHAEVTLVDWDVESAHAGEPDLVAVQVADATQRVFVDRFKALPLQELAGSDVERMIEARFPNEPPYAERLTDRELATVLAALRQFQQSAGQASHAEAMPQFTEHDPLSVEEIDSLCERLNCD